MTKQNALHFKMEGVCSMERDGEVKMIGPVTY